MFKTLISWDYHLLYEANSNKRLSSLLMSRFNPKLMAWIELWWLLLLQRAGSGPPECTQRSAHVSFETCASRHSSFIWIANILPGKFSLPLKEWAILCRKCKNKVCFVAFLMPSGMWKWNRRMNRCSSFGDRMLGVSPPILFLPHCLQ